MADGDEIIGDIVPPSWLPEHGGVGVTDPGGFGLINFFSNVLRLLTIIAGLWGLLNLIFAGWGYITSGGDPEKVKGATSKINNSLIGLAIIAASYTVAAIIGWIFFGNPTMIISPQITGVGK